MGELAAEGIPVVVTCWVLKLARHPYYRWLANPVTDAEYRAAQRANALLDAVCVIRDQQTGAPYVGAAYGDDGIWQRLCTYAATLHDGNVQLEALIAEKGEQYAPQNLRFALLECLTTSA